MAQGPFLLDPLGEELVEWVRPGSSPTGSPSPLEVEVGFGRGRFLLLHSERHPDTRILGFEVQRRFCEHVMRELEHRGAANVRVVQSDARPILDELIPDRRVRTVHVNFPDPWWKKRHHRRRVFSLELVSVLARKLEPGGSAILRTDVTEYAAAVRELFEQDGRFAHEPLPPSALPMTHRERRCEELGLPVHRHRFILKGETV